MKKGLKGAQAPLYKNRCCIIQKGDSLPEFPFYYNFENQVPHTSPINQVETFLDDPIEEDDSQEQLIILAKDSQSLVESIDSSDEH